MRWIPLFELGNYKLHRWVKNVVALYASGKTKPYMAKPPVQQKVNRSKTFYQETGEGLFFDMAEMLLKKKRVLKNIKTNLFYDLCN